MILNRFKPIGLIRAFMMLYVTNNTRNHHEKRHSTQHHKPRPALPSRLHSGLSKRVKEHSLALDARRQISKAHQAIDARNSMERLRRVNWLESKESA